MSGLLASGHVSPIGRTPFLLYFTSIILTVIGECGSTSSGCFDDLLLIPIISILRNFGELKLALKWAS